VKVVAITAYLLCGMRWLKVVLPEMMRYRLEDQLPRIHAQTLVLYGEFDANCLPDWADTVVALLPHAQAWEVRDAAHSVIVAHARAIARLCAHHAGQPLPPPAPTTNDTAFPPKQSPSPLFRPSCGRSPGAGAPSCSASSAVTTS
jgi:hypothetical protein